METSTTTNPADKFFNVYALKFHLERCVLYYAFFDNRWSSIKTFLKAANFIAFAFACAFILRPVNPWVAVLFPAFGLLSYLFEYCFKMDEHIAANRKKAEEFRTMVDSFPDELETMPNERIEEIKAKRRALESGERVYECISARLHNTVAARKSLRHDYRLSFLERTLGQWLPLRYTPKPLPHLAEQVKAEIPA